MSNVYKPILAPGWQAVITGPPVESAACVLFRHHHIITGWRTLDGIPMGRAGAPGGDIARGEAPRQAATRIVLEETGLDLSAHYLIYQGKREFAIRTKPQPVHLYLCFLDWAASRDDDRARLRRADWTPERRDAFERSINCGDPAVQTGRRFGLWATHHIQEAEASPQGFSPIVQWALEIVCRRPAEVSLPWEVEGVPIRVAGLND